MQLPCEPRSQERYTEAKQQTITIRDESPSAGAVGSHSVDGKQGGARAPDCNASLCSTAQAPHSRFTNNSRNCVSEVTAHRTLGVGGGLLSDGAHRGEVVGVDANDRKASVNDLETPILSAK